MTHPLHVFAHLFNAVQPHTAVSLHRQLNPLDAEVGHRRPKHADLRRSLLVPRLRLPTLPHTW